LAHSAKGSSRRQRRFVLNAQRRRCVNASTARRRDLPDSNIGTFSPRLYKQAKSDGWSVISMKNDWKRVFAFEK
jgi:hypothetical protein